MSWEQLDLEIAEMFGEYTDRDYDYQTAIESHIAFTVARKSDFYKDPWNRKRALARVNQWREQHPDEHRERTREAMRRYRARRKDDPAYRAHRAELERKRYERCKAAMKEAA